MKESNISFVATKYIKWGVYLLILLALLIIAIVISLKTGELKVSFADMVNAFSDNNESISSSIITKIRLPRIILGLSVGGALSIAGVILQGVYRNPLVEPYTLGISGGAAFGAALVIVMGLHQSLGIIMLPIFGFAGALIIIILVYSLSIKNGSIRIQNMLLTGIMVSFIASSSMMFLMATTTSENLHGIVFWIMGSLNESNDLLISIAFFSSIIGLIVAYMYVLPLNALRLGEEKAMHLGINTETSIRVLFVVSSLLTGICVSVAGVIGFVGLIIPHIMRLVVGSDFRILLISSYLGGSIFLIFSDTIARTIISPNELPIGVITGIVGGVIFVVVLSKNMSKAVKF